MKTLKLLILLSTGYAVAMLLHWPIGFTLFTQTSNLFVAAVCACQLLNRRPSRRKALALWKYAAVVSVVVTFLVYSTVLGPAEAGGLLAAYRQDHWASLCLHLITPALAVADFLVNDARERSWRRRDVIAAIAPPLAWYLATLAMSLCGFRWWGMTGPYPFLNYEAPAGWFGFMPDTVGRRSMGIGVGYAVIAMIALFLLVGCALAAIAERIKREPV